MNDSPLPEIPQFNILTDNIKEAQLSSTAKPVSNYYPTPMEKSDMERAYEILGNRDSEISSIREAVLMLKRLAEKGCINVCISLAYWYRDGSHFLKKVPEKYLYYMSKAADAGSVEAMSSLAWTYLTGRHGVEQDTFSAHVYYYQLHQMLPSDKEYALYYALGLFNGHPSNPCSNSEMIFSTLLEVSDFILDKDICTYGIRGYGYAMIQSLANEGYPQAQAVLREVHKAIAAGLAAKAVMSMIEANI